MLWRAMDSGNLLGSCYRWRTTTQNLWLAVENSLYSMFWTGLNTNDPPFFMNRWTVVLYYQKLLFTSIPNVSRKASSTTIIPGLQRQICLVYVARPFCDNSEPHSISFFGGQFHCWVPWELKELLRVKRNPAVYIFFLVKSSRGIVSIIWSQLT